VTLDFLKTNKRDLPLIFMNFLCFWQQRKAKYMRQDANLQALLAQFAQKDPLVYLRACANHLHFNLPEQ
jgi:hypothetical protein